MKKPENITVTDVEEAIGIPANKWVNRCHEIASAIVDAGLVKGRAVYGIYTGPVSESSYFSGDRPGHRHGWVKLKDGRVLDPTRWVFEDVPPYIFCHKRPREYDEGMQSLKAAWRRPCPTEEECNGDAGFTLMLPPATAIHLKALADNQGKREDCSYAAPRMLIGWLANLSVMELDKHALPFYVALANKGLKALVPIDNWMAVMEEHDEA